MIKRPDTNAQRLKRHKRVRAKISGTPERPRLNVFRSKQNIYAQIIDDTTGKTLVSASTMEAAVQALSGKKDTTAESQSSQRVPARAAFSSDEGRKYNALRKQQ